MLQGGEAEGQETHRQKRQETRGWRWLAVVGGWLVAVCLPHGLNMLCFAAVTEYSRSVCVWHTTHLLHHCLELGVVGAEQQR